MVKTKLTVPSKLSEITLGQYQKFAKIAEKDQEEDFLQKKMIEIFCGVPLKYVDNFKYTSIKKVTTVLVQMFKEKTNLIERFKMDGVEYGFIPKLDDMSFGEYADLDQLMKDWDTMDKALAVLYRPVKKSYSGRYIIEEYDVDKTKPMAGMPLDVAFSAVFFFSQFKRGINEAYPALFSKGSEDFDTSAKASFHDTFGWFTSLYQMAQGDPTKFSRVEKLNINTCLTYLTFVKQKNEIEAKEIKRKSRGR